MMRNIITIIIIISTLFSLSFSQGGSETEKMMLYESQKKSPNKAMLYSLLLSSAGHYYAGNWARGLGFTAARFGFVALAITTGFEEKEVDHGWYTETKLEATSSYYIGMGGAIITALLEVVDASNEVKKYNARLYERIFGKKQPGFSFNCFPSRERTRLQLTYNF